MELTIEKAITLKHYCNSIDEALRSILNTKNVSDINHEYWINSLNNFSNLLDSILQQDSNTYKKLLIKNFNALIKGGYLNKSVDDLFQTAETITKEVYAKINRGEL